MKKRIQNKIAESRWTFPLVLGYGILITLLEGFIDKESWFAVASIILSTVLMVELNNRFALIRIYSRMVSSSFLVLTVMSPALLQSPKACIAQMAIIGFYIIFFMAYQDRNAAGRMFYAFFMLGAVSVIWVQALYFVPLLWILMATYNMAGSLKNMMGTLLGLMAPYWFLSPYYIYKGEMSLMVRHFLGLGKFGPLADLSVLSNKQIISLCFITLLFIIGTIHFLRNSYMDKIRIRMTYSTFIVMGLSAIAFLILQPQHYDILIRFILVSTSALIGHYFALTHTKLTNISFLLITIATLLLTAYNIVTA